MLKKRWLLLCFRDLGDSKIDPKIDAGKKASKWLSGAQGAKEFCFSLAWRNARGPQRLSFQKNPSEENREESRLKGENKVECKKWSAKRVSTERQVQTGNPLRT